MKITHYVSKVIEAIKIQFKNLEEPEGNGKHEQNNKDDIITMNELKI